MASSNLNDLIKTLLRQYRLCISDFDGVQGFTEALQMQAYITIIEKYAGVKPDADVIAKELVGKTAVDNLTTLKARYHFASEIPALVAEREKVYLASVFQTTLQPNRFMVDICRAFSEHGSKPVIVSNSNREVIEAILDYWKTRDLFAAVYASDTFPNRELPMRERKLDFIVNHLPKAYGLPPQEMIVFEDSASTCRALEAAGFATGFVRHRFNEPFTPRTGIVLEQGM